MKNNPNNADIEAWPILERSPDLVCIAGKLGYFKKINHSVIEKLEYAEAELMAVPISSFIHPDDKERTKKVREKLINGEPLVNFQNRYIAKSGKVIWLDWTSVYFAEREEVLAIARDVTERKLAELKTDENFKKYKGLARHFKSTIEKDRKNFAFELHEELAQLAAVIKMDIDWIKCSLETNASDFLKGRLEHAMEISEMLINSIRKISLSVSPYTMDMLGLNDTLSWLCRDFTKQNNIPCTCIVICNEANLTHEIKLDFFRICQEALANVVAHANASSVHIQIEDKENRELVTKS